MSKERNLGELIQQIQIKIKSLENEVKAINYTEVFCIERDNKLAIDKCISKIEVLNEILISFGIQDK